MESTYRYLQCEGCREPSKYAIGFWDGRDCWDSRPYDSNAWDCNNFNCNIKQERDWKAASETNQQMETRQDNKQNGANVIRLKRVRRKAHCSVENISYALGISPAKYVAYEVEQETMPIHLYELAVAYFNYE